MNHVTLIGNLSRDVDVRTTPNGVTVANFSIAVGRRFKNASGEKVTDFHNIVVWKTLAEICGKYLSKGKKVAVVGELQTRQYEAKDGSKRTVTEIVADEVEFLTPRETAHTQSGFEDNFDDDPDSELPF